MQSPQQAAGFTAAIRIVPRTSPVLRRALIGLHLGLIAVAPMALADPWAALLLALASALHATQWLRELARQSAAGPTVLFDSAGRWWIQQPDGRRTAARLARRRLVLPWLLVLPLRAAGERGTRRLILLADNLPADDFRRLRVRLLWQQESKDL